MKSIDAAIFIFPFYPDFKPPSPENPSRPLRVSQVLRSRVVITIVLIKTDSLNRNLKSLILDNLGVLQHELQHPQISSFSITALSAPCLKYTSP